MEDIIRTSSLSVGYDGIPVLQDIDLGIPQGKITVILGTSGSGKTTLMKSLIGLLPPLGGRVFFAGDEVDYESEQSLNTLYRRIGVLYQNGALLNSLTLYHNIALPIRMLHPATAKEIEREMVFSGLSRVGLEDAWYKFPAELSGGMRKRAALARAMVLDPQVIFCDEPSSGLDPIIATELDGLLIQMRDLFEATVVVVTHELRSIQNIADRVLVLHGGTQHFEGSLSQFTQSRDSFISRFLLREGSNV